MCEFFERIKQENLYKVPNDTSRSSIITGFLPFSRECWPGRTHSRHTVLQSFPALLAWRKCLFFSWRVSTLLPPASATPTHTCTHACARTCPQFYFLLVPRVVSLCFILASPVRAPSHSHKFPQASCAESRLPQDPVGSLALDKAPGVFFGNRSHLGARLGWEASSVPELTALHWGPEVKGPRGSQGPGAWKRDILKAQWRSYKLLLSSPGQIVFSKHGCNILSHPTRFNLDPPPWDVGSNPLALEIWTELLICLYPVECSRSGLCDLQD